MSLIAALWSMEQIRVGNGEGTGRNRLVKGVLYGSDKRNGRPRTFFEMGRGSLLLFESSLRTGMPLALAGKYGHYEHCGEDLCLEVEDTNGIVEHAIRKRIYVAGLMERNVDDIPGLVLDTFGPWARGENKALRNFIVRCYCCVYARSNDGMCASAVSANGVVVLEVKEKVENVYNAWEKLKPKTSSLSDLNHLVQGMKKLVLDREVPRIQLQRISKMNMKEFEKDRFSWLVKTDGVWVMRLEEKSEFDHMR